jgi:hypothetical protein
MATPCACESTVCHHGNHPCKREAETSVRTIYGTFEMCGPCARLMPGKSTSIPSLLDVRR